MMLDVNKTMGTRNGTEELGVVSGEGEVGRGE